MAASCMQLLWIYLMINTAGCLRCMVYQQSDGTVLYQLNKQAVPGCQFDWLIDGRVVAHEEDFNRTLILDRTTDSILMNKYHPKTVYKEDCFDSGPRIAVCNIPWNGAPDYGYKKMRVTIAVAMTLLRRNWFL